jgi:hypothetical protein
MKIFSCPAYAVVALLCLSLPGFPQKDPFAVTKANTVQLDVASLLNDRVVFTQQDGKLQPALHSLDTGDTSVLITEAAAAVAESGALTALPNSDLFAANGRHPAVKLHYAQPDGGFQVHQSVARTDTYEIPLAGQRFRQVQLFFASAQGETPLLVKLTYKEGNVGERTTTVPDFYFLPKAEDPRWFVLTGDFGKVNLKGKMTEATHHYLHGFDLNPDPTRHLLKITITKQDSGSVLNFFGATGMVAEATAHTGKSSHHSAH